MPLVPEPKPDNDAESQRGFAVVAFHFFGRKLCHAPANRRTGYDCGA